MFAVGLCVLWWSHAEPLAEPHSRTSRADLEPKPSRNADMSLNVESPATAPNSEKVGRAFVLRVQPGHEGRESPNRTSVWTFSLTRPCPSRLLTLINR